jgi:hypothetical protein
MNQVDTISEYVSEVQTWERLISIFRYENVCLKTRLSEIVNSTDEEEHLVSAENFQEEFLGFDRVVSYLCQEVKTQKKLLERQADMEADIPESLEVNQSNLRKDIKKAKQLFSRVKYEFTEFMEAHC